MSFHELGHDLVLARELGFEQFDLADVGVIDDLGLSAVVEGDVSVLEERPLPQIEEGGIDVELIAQVGNGDAFEQMAFDDAGLFLRGEMTPRSPVVGHKYTSVQNMLTQTGASSNSD